MAEHSGFVGQRCNSSQSSTRINAAFTARATCRLDCANARASPPSGALMLMLTCYSALMRRR